MAEERRPWIPAEAARGGVKTIYPEYRSVMNGSVNVNALTVPSSKSAVSASKRIADQSPRDGEVHVLPLQGNVYVLVADGTNITASIGPEGVLLVNTGAAQMSDKVLGRRQPAGQSDGHAADAQQLLRRELSRSLGMGQPVHECGHQLDDAARSRFATSSTPARLAEHVGGNEKIATSGFYPRGGNFGGAVENIGRAGVDRRARKRAQSDERAGGQSGARSRPLRSRPIRISTTCTSFPRISTVKR